MRNYWPDNFIPGWNTQKDRHYSRAEEIQAIQRVLMWAVEQGHPEAQYGLGRDHHKGRNTYGQVPSGFVSEIHAAKWYHKAAKQGHAMAQFDLGEMYRRGAPNTVNQNYTKAVKWYRKAAEQGHENAQFMLGLMYSLGKGVPEENKAEAIKWYRRAAEQGFGNARRELEKLEAK